MRDALAALPWVEPDSIHPDRDRRQVRFTVTDRNQFDMAAVGAALREKGYDQATRLAGPTEP